MNIFLESVIPLQGNFNAGAILTIIAEMHDFVNCRFVGIKEFNKRFQAALVGVNLFFATALISQHNTHTGVQERQLSQPLSQDFKVEFNIGKGAYGGHEMDFGAGLFRVTHNSKGTLRFTMRVVLLMYLTIAANSQAQCN